MRNGSVLAVVALLAGSSLAVLPLAGAGRAWAADSDPATAAQVVKDTCSACHGLDGNSADATYPKLAGQNPAYLAAQLRAFRSGARKSEVMAPVAAGLSDAQIDGLSDYFARQRRTPDAVANAALAARGARVFASARPGAPACSACHGGGGGRGTGMMGGRGMMGRGGMMGGRGMVPNMAEVPNLNGQHAAYLVGQLDAFASGARTGSVMNGIAPALSEADRKAVAAYLSGLR
jgi:cytochrome c553